MSYGPTAADRREAAARTCLKFAAQETRRGKPKVAAYWNGEAELHRKAAGEWRRLAREIEP